MDRFLTPGKLEVINLTPHPVTLIDNRMVSIKRNGQVFLQEDVKIEEAILERYMPSGQSLSVQEDMSNYDTIGDVALYSQLGNARFDSVMQPDVKDNDIIIVSSKCARLFLVHAFGIVSGINQFSQVSLIDIDRIYVPKMVVYSTEWGKVVPVGALGLQQVAPMISIAAYQQALKSNVDKQIPVSVASLIKKVNAMKAFTLGNQIPDEIQKYITDRGF